MTLILFLCLLTISILQFMDQGIIFTSISFENTFHRAAAAIDSDSSGESGQNKLKNF